jgi:hypothetical protein
MTFAYGEDVFRDRRRPIADPYNPDSTTVGAWTDDSSTFDTITLEGVYIDSTSANALPDAMRTEQQITKSLYSQDRTVDVKTGDRIRTVDGDTFYVNVRPAKDVNPFTGWAPGIEIPLSGVQG